LKIQKFAEDFLFKTPWKNAKICVGVMKAKELKFWQEITCWPTSESAYSDLKIKKKLETFFGKLWNVYKFPSLKPSQKRNK
jgi:hypothetical protein